MLIFKFPSVTSTQDLAEAIYYMINAEEFVVTAEEQTNARGRYRREWYSPKGGLWITYVVKNYDVDKVPFLTLKVSLGIRNALAKYVNAGIRWPNDIVVGNKKIAGVLIEGIAEGSSGTVFIGAGIDTNVTRFPEDIIATSILPETGKEVDNDELLNEIINSIKNIMNLDDRTTIDKINEVLQIKDKKIRIMGQDWEKICKTLFVDYYGRLVTDCGIFEVEEVMRVESLDN